VLLTPACDSTHVSTRVHTTRVLLAHRPVGIATADCFVLERTDLDELADGAIRIGVEFVAIGAGTRTKLRGEGFHEQAGVGGLIPVTGVGRVIE
jgi:NADPH-dependent curcumin reductase CurA